MVEQGTDPIDHRRSQRALDRAQSTTFRQAAEAYLKIHTPSWSNQKHAGQWRATLQTYAYPIIGDVSVAAISAELVRQVLAPIWSTKTETANRVRGRIEAILDDASVRGWRPTGDNPARWKGNLEHSLPRRSKVAPVQHHKSMPYQDVPAFWRVLQTRSATSARALSLLILTATRTTEILGARWDEVDIDGAAWLIPAARMKARKDHRVPLPAAAVDLLRTLPRLDQDIVFPSERAGQPLSNMALLKMLQRLEVAVTAHGFRASFRTWAADDGYPADLCEAALAHTQDRLIDAYQRGDLLERRRRMMAHWAAHVTGSPQAATVTPLLTAAP